MTEKEFRPLPAPGDIVYCHFPEEVDVPGPKPRPAFVLGVGISEGGKRAVRVAYGTSKNVNEKFRGEFEITPDDGIAFALSGLSLPTKFNLRKWFFLEYTDRWFRVPPNPRHGQTPKLGTLHSSLMRRAEAAYAAAAEPE